MKISEVYKKYWVPPNLQDHLYRVAAVGTQIVDGWKSGSIDSDLVKKVLLLHDIANIVKFVFFDLEHPRLLSEEEKTLEYWKKIQADFIARYGSNDHVATVKIAREIKVDGEVVAVLKKMGSEKFFEAIESDDYLRKICFYSDCRVAPGGVVSIKERFSDVVNRYKDRVFRFSDSLKNKKRLVGGLLLEKQVQEKVDFDLLDISDESIKLSLQELPDFLIIS